MFRPPTRYKQGQRNLNLEDQAGLKAIMENPKQRPNTRHAGGYEIPLIVSTDYSLQRRISTANKFSRNGEKMQTSLDKEFLCLFN